MDSGVRRVLFLDLESHKATGSSDFFVELLRRRFSVVRRYAKSRLSRDMPKRSDVAGFDCVVCWQLIPGNAQSLSWGKPCVHVPMFDGETGNLVKWIRNALQGVRAIGFCQAECRLLERARVKSLHVRYFPAPSPFSPGDPRRAFLWHRGKLGFADVKRQLPASAFDELVVRCGRGEADAISEDDKSRYHVRTVVANDGDTKESYLSLYSGCGVFFEPRYEEGIGLAFLEAMSAGKCVIAHDAPTMNEYIASGRNGILLDFRDPQSAPVQLPDRQTVETIQRSAYETCVEGRRRWEAECEDAILDFIDAAISEHRGMGFFKRLLWWLLLPAHLAWDAKTLFQKLLRRG